MVAYVGIYNSSLVENLGVFNVAILLKTWQFYMPAMQLFDILEIWQLIIFTFILCDLVFMCFLDLFVCFLEFDVRDQNHP